MKLADIMILSCIETALVMITPFWSLAGEINNRVNFHLKSVASRVESNYVNSQIKAHDESSVTPTSAGASGRSKTGTTEGLNYSNQPGFGIGDENTSSYETPSTEVLDQTPPHKLTAEESIRLERKQATLNDGRSTTSIEDAAPIISKDKYIDQFKANAAKKGVQIYVDPVTLNARRIN